MAITLAKTKVSVDLGNIVNNAIVAVKAERANQQAKKEAEFQRAIADGMSYEEQVKFREEQLADEKASDFNDADYISKLEKSVADTKKLSRFNKYRTKYAQTVSELSSGKINEETYLKTLQETLVGIDDPDLRLEIQNDITTAVGKVKEYNDTILSNQVKKAKYDGTQATLTDAISRVNNAKMAAAISGNDDEVTAYDETLSALTSQLSTVRIQDSLTEFQVKSSTRGVNPIEKLNFINSEIQKADPNVAIKIGDRTYANAQQYWSLERDNFLAGSSQIFGNFFDELGKEAKNVVDASTAKFGYPTQSVLDSTIQTFNDLKSRPEVAPFASKLDITQAGVMSDAVDKIAKVINNVGTNNLTFKEADAQLQNIGAKYGIDVSNYRLQLDENLRNLARGGIITDAEALKMAPDVNVALPKVDNKPAVTPTPGSTPSITPATVRTVKAGDTLSAIAREAGISLSEVLKLNPDIKNANLIRTGQEIKLPGAPTPEAPATPALPTNTPTPTPTPPPPANAPQPPAVNPPAAPQPPTVVAPKPPTPAPVSQTTPTPKSTYTGSSIVDFLKSTGQDSSATSRAKLALEKGIVKSEDEYLKAAQTGQNAGYNEKLLKALRGS